jgi:signal transduction histidine kinase/FixJ family two-component response regulator
VSLPANGDRGGSTGDPECFVICVDDDAEFVKSLELFLPGRVREASVAAPTYRFLFFTDPGDALEAVDEIKSEHGVLTMVISDQQMPQMKGTAFLGRIRERTPDCIRVLLTGHAGLESAIAAINDQLLDKYLTKPVDNEHDFTVSIVHLLQRFWMQRTIDSQRRMIGDLYRFSNTLSALSALPPTVEQITAFARDAFGCRHASVWLLEGDAFVRHEGWESTSPVARVRVSGPEVEKLWNSRIARVSPGDPGSLSEALEKAELPEAPYLRATLLSASEVLGVLLVGDRLSGAAFDARDEEILTYIADTASIAIYNQLQSAELAQAYRESSAQALALASANERLRMLDRLKDDFLTFVSHELRTPLAVLAAVEFLDAGGRPDQVQVVEVLRNGYDRLKRFIETALAYRESIGEPTRLEEMHDLADLLDGARQQVPGLANTTTKVEIVLPAEPCRVRGGASQLTEVIRILLDNAVRFSPDEARIRVACEASPDEVRLSVEDCGVGFPPELREEILKPFTIADTLHHKSGSALNLAKANAIVIAHGGVLQAESKGEGQGARFTVKLPRVAPDDARLPSEA